MGKLGRAIGAVLLTLGVLVLIAGGLFALIVGVFSAVGYGDHGPHFAAEDVGIPAAVLTFGALLTWAGRALRLANPRPPPSAPPPG